MQFYIQVVYNVAENGLQWYNENHKNLITEGGFVMQFKRRDGLLSAIFGILTCGLYSIYYWYQYGEDVNVICSEDGKVTQNYIVAWLLGIITCGIYSLYWIYSLASRLDTASKKYDVNVESPALFTLIMSVPFLSYFYSSDVLNKFAERYEEMYPNGNGYTGNGYNSNGYAGNGFGGGVPPVSPQSGSSQGAGNTAQSIGAQFGAQFKSAVQDVGSTIRNTAQSVMPTCKNCGAAISPGKNYCKRCGYPVDGPAPQNTQANAVPRQEPPMEREVQIEQIPPMEQEVQQSPVSSMTWDTKTEPVPPTVQNSQEETIQLVWTGTEKQEEPEKPDVQQQESTSAPICSMCGKSVKPGDRFCIHCGSKIE